MAIIKWKPWMPINPEDIWPEFNWATDLLPNVGIDVYETDDAVVVEAPIPGVPEEDVNVSIEGNVLTIEASSEETEEEKDAKKAVYRETRQKAFHYTVNLPRGVDAENADATVENGVLKVSIPIADAEKRKRIPVKSKK